MRRFATTVRFASAISLLLIGGVCLLTPAQVGTQPPTRLTVAAMFDEYGQVGGCDHSARLDNFAIALQNDPGMNGYIVIYGPEGERGGSGKRQFAVINDYLVNSRGLAGDRINLIYGGRNDDLTEPKIQLWLAPPEAEPPEPQRYKTNIRTFSGKFIEYEAWDVSSVEYFGEGEMTGPPVAGVTLDSFADMLSQQSEAAAYVVTYNGSEAVPGAWRRVAERDVDRLRKLGVEPDRLKVIYGGRSKKTRVQLWIQPKTAPPPVIDAGPEALPKSAVQMETFSDYQLGSEENKQHAFNDLLRVLRLNENLRVCLIVRLESLAPPKDEEAETNTSSEENTVAEAPDLYASENGTSNELVESPPADFPALVQKWSVELAEHKIAADRLIVLYVPTREFEGNTLETWIVPPGQPLPDPMAEPKELDDQEEQSHDTKKPPLKAAK